MSRSLALFAILVFVGLLVAPAAAQDGKVTVMNLKVIGKIVSLSADSIGVETDNGQKWSVLLKNQFGEVAKVTVRRPVSDAELKAGVYVSFMAELDIRGNIQAPIDKLAIFTPGEVKTPGLFEDAEDTSDEGGRRITRYLVNAMITSRNGKQLTLAVPGKVLRGTLADSVAMKAEFEDLKMAKPGHQIVVDGFYQANGPQIPKGSMVPRKIQVLIDGAKADEEEVARAGSNKPAQPAPNQPSNGPARPKPGDGVGEIVEIN